MKSKHVDRSVKKKWACTECDYSSDRKSDYKNHLITHSNIKGHKCDTGDKCFTTKSSLNRHIKSVHTKEYKVDCEVCDKVFTRTSGLLKHIKTVRYKIRCFACTECGKTFAQNCVLTNHMRTHT